MANEYYYTRPPAAIPDYITPSLGDDSEMSFAMHALTTIQPDDVRSKGRAIIKLSAPPSALRVKETHAEIMALIHQAQYLTS